MSTLHHLEGPLKQLRLSGMLDSLEGRCRQAVDVMIGPTIPQNDRIENSSV